MDREVWHPAVHGVSKSRTRLSDWTDWLTDWYVKFPTHSRCSKTLISSSLLRKKSSSFIPGPIRRWESTERDWRGNTASSESTSITYYSFIYSFSKNLPSMYRVLSTILNAWEDQTWSLAITSPTTPHTLSCSLQEHLRQRRGSERTISLSEAGCQGAEPIAQWTHCVVAVRKGNSVQALRNCSVWRKGWRKCYSFNHYLQSQPCMHIVGTFQEDRVDSRAKQTGIVNGRTFGV